MINQTVLGNEAIAWGLLEQGCQVATAYPGTPSSEILASVKKHQKRCDRQIYSEWSVNEKVAFEIALAASWTGLRAAVAMKQVGLNAAADPLFSAAYTGVKGGLIVISADDPGPHSSQTEQDSRLMALNAKVPVLDPGSPAEARVMVKHAYALSERFGVPVMLRPTTRLCHARQNLTLDPDSLSKVDTPVGRFRKDPKRWAATPKFRYRLHLELNQKLADIEAEFTESPLNYVVDQGSSDRVGVIGSGVAFNTARQSLLDMGAQVPLLKIGTPYPLPRALIEEFMNRFQTVVVLEEPAACIELQLPERRRVRGRLDGTVPAAGELTPEVVSDVLSGVLTEAGIEFNSRREDTALQELISSLPLPVRKPRLCPGCPHRSVFYTIRREFGPSAIYPGDIGCYTLGLNLRAVDTCVDMGASISMAAGFYQANRLVGDKRPIVATIGDSTFLHSGIGPLINAVHTGARFVLLILDNDTTAMTGFQPTAASRNSSDSGNGRRRVSIAELVGACGATFVKVVDPYEQEAFGQIVRQAYEHSQAAEGGVAVIIAERPCVLHEPLPNQQEPIPVLVTEECDGCRYCVEAFECPALVLNPDGSRVDVDQTLCAECGQCVDACYKGFIVPQVMETNIQANSKAQEGSYEGFLIPQVTETGSRDL